MGKLQDYSNMDKITEIKNYVYPIFHKDPTGHDYYHLKRVAMLAKQIAELEDGNVQLCVASAWLHDIGDPKLFPNGNEATFEMNQFLAKIGYTRNEIEQINEIISSVSFQKGLSPKTIEGKIVQDADRLDAIGAIGIARTFAYGGANNQLIYEPNHEEGTSIHHFYDKLLKLKDRMHTDSAKNIAEDRHQFLIQYLNTFHDEWGYN